MDPIPDTMHGQSIPIPGLTGKTSPYDASAEAVDNEYEVVFEEQLDKLSRLTEGLESLRNQSLPTQERAEAAIEMLDKYATEGTGLLHSPEGLRELIEMYASRDRELCRFGIMERFGTSPFTWEGLRHATPIDPTMGRRQKQKQQYKGDGPRTPRKSPSNLLLQQPLHS